ncbi:MAG: DUF1549 domain-containing protein, partial [Planctomycetota bacterium]
MAPVIVAEEPPAEFFRGINLGGASVVIDGHRWQGDPSPGLVCQAKRFENPAVRLLPATDAARSRMLRSSRWASPTMRARLNGLPPGRYTVFLYVWEDNNPEVYSVAVNGRVVLAAHDSGRAGRWERLGPWPVDVVAEGQWGGAIDIVAQGGAANFSGIEIWRGRHDGRQPDWYVAEDIALFENKIRPLFVERCYECHSSEMDAAEGGLWVDSRQSLLQGGATAPAIVPGDPDGSLLIQAVRYDRDRLQMPPDEKLSEAEIADLEEWIRRGAPDPRQGGVVPRRSTIDLAAARQHWAFRPVVDPPVPSLDHRQWSHHPIDRFLVERLEKAGLRPVVDAAPLALIRRMTYDLWGLPPDPADARRFAAEYARDPQAAVASAVDRLLASPRYGERWGRHWMDLVRYADTAGDNSDYPVPQAYLYRNYVIDAFNADKPYDQFIREQIAGDLLPASDDAARNEQIIATGYIAIARRFGSVIKDYPQHLTIEDTIDNLGRTFLGLTLTCARCHDHKFDPISQVDYYGIYGMLASTRYPFPGIELDKKPRDFVPLWESGKPNPTRLAYAVAEGLVADAALQIRGDPKRLGDVVPRKFLDVLGGQTLSPDEAVTSGRRQLA